MVNLSRAQPAKPATAKASFSAEELAHIMEFKKRFANIFNIHIILVRDCAMKEARAFLILTNLRRMGEIVVSHPDELALKQGAFELDFEVTLATNEQQQLLQQELNTLSDIEHITITPVEVESKAEKGVQTDY